MRTTWSAAWPRTRTATPTHNYRNVDGGIPIPATLSIELGKLISARNDAVRYKFVSDYPFASRGKYDLDAFERKAISALRTDPKKPVVRRRGLDLRPLDPARERRAPWDRPA